MLSKELESLLSIPSTPLSADQKRINLLVLHRLWTLALGSPAYNKADWMGIESQLATAQMLR